MKSLKTGLLLMLMTACTWGVSSCSSGEEDGLSKIDTSGKPRKDYGYLPNGKRLVRLSPSAKYSPCCYRFTYSDEGVIKEATDGYRTYTFADDLSTVTKERSGGQIVEYALYYNKDGNLSGLGNMSTNDADTKNITSVFMYEDGICVGVKQINKETVDLDGVQYELGQKWQNGTPVYQASSYSNVSLTKYTCSIDNPLGVNSFNCALMIWGETDVRCILQLLGFLGKGPSKFITTREMETWRSDDNITYTLLSNQSSVCHYNYHMNSDGTLSIETCREINSYDFSYIYQ